MKNFFSMVFIIILLIQNNFFANDQVNQILQAIEEKNAKWTARENSTIRILFEEYKQLPDDLKRPHDQLNSNILTLPLIDNLPVRLDWRNNNGNWVTPPKNEYEPNWCGACWLMAGIGMIESWWKIYNNEPDSVIDLSEQFVLSCGNAGTCSGGLSELVLEFAKKTGVPHEDCFPYEADDEILCDMACENWADKTVKVTGWGFVTFGEAFQENIKTALYRHPVVAEMVVYEDFVNYAGGVYEYVWGDFVYGHQILIIGWDDEQQCWICKNSFGTDWGETSQFTPYTEGAGDGGYCRIKYGECNIGSFCHTIRDELTGESALKISSNEVNLGLSVGDTSAVHISLSNSGLNEIEYAAIDYESSEISYFHLDSRDAWDGLSWWCGDPQLGGYDNAWMQYLDLPVLNLTNTTNPKLSFTGFWALELPPGPYDWLSFIYDGYDASNVWVSVNGGESFDVIDPAFPKYNSHNTFSFGDASSWKLGLGIAGWSGNSGGWIPAEFDLSSYKSDSVIIRFAFSSDRGYSTRDDQQLTGFFIDDIIVADGGTVLFENYGEMDPSMSQTGFAGLQAADWLEVIPRTGKIQPDYSIPVTIHINTGLLTTGKHCGLIYITSNDTTNLPSLYSEIVQINLALITDLEGKRVTQKPTKWNLEQNYPNPFNPKTIINYELRIANHVDLSIYNILGQKVITLVSEKQKAGSYQVEWDATGLSSGVYIYTLETSAGFKQSRKLVLLK